jgi:two-component system, NtrC family, response regulator HydG
MKWHGNVRELENTVERAVVLSSGSLIDASDLESFLQKEELTETPSETPYGGRDFVWPQGNERVPTLDEAAKRYIYHVFKLNHGAREKTANDLNIDRKTLYRKLREIEQESWYIR